MADKIMTIGLIMLYSGAIICVCGAMMYLVGMMIEEVM